MPLARRFGFALGLAAFLGLVDYSSPARASWPMARHDSQRIGAVKGTSNVGNPTNYWRTYLGGAITGTQMLTADANGDGKLDFLLATGGPVTAVQTDGTVIWRSSLLAIQAFAALADVTGDGTPDIIAYSGDHVIILSLGTGAVEWEEPTGEMGTIGAVRVGDVTGDGKPDVLAVECGCCAVNSGNSGFFWTFGNGFASAQNLGSLPVFTCGTSDSATLIQADASSEYETLVADASHFALVADDGTVLAQTGTIGTNTEEHKCTTANIDGVAGDEAVCILNSSDAPATNQRRITVLHYDYTVQPPTLNVLWSNVVAPDAGGNLQVVDPLEDLDGDGQFEIVASTDEPTNGWATHIYDAVTGTDLVTPIPGQIVAGTAPMETATSRVMLESSGTTLSGWAFTRTPSPAVAQHWSQLNATASTYPNPALVPLQSVTSVVLATDLTGDGLADAITQSVTTGSQTSLVALSGAAGDVMQAATLSLPTDVGVLTSWIVPPMSVATPQVAMARTDGILNLLSGQLALTSTGTPPQEIDVPTGGYYATGAWRELYHAPRLFALGAGASQSVIVNDSRLALLRLDAATASEAVPPARTWQLTHTFGPTIMNGLNGAGPAMACLAETEPVTSPPQYRVRAVGANGSLLWDEALAGIPLNDLAPGNFNGDSVPDFAIQLGSSSNLDLSTEAFSGVDGTVLWATPAFYPGAGGFQSAGVSVGSFGQAAGDGGVAADSGVGPLGTDVYFQGGATIVLSGANGSQIASGGPTNSYSLPLLYDTNGDGLNEVALGAGFWPASLYSADLQTALWTSTDADRPYPYAAIAECPGTPPVPMLVEGSLQNPARLKLTPLNGSSLGEFTTVVLAGGSLYPNEGAAGSAFLGQLTSANVHSNLTGAGHPTAVVGSSDGWLYGVNPCAGILDFSVSVGSAVGEAVFGDTDGDGNDEILVTAADGYLYDYKGFSIAAPAFVWDTDPPAVTNHEVSSVVTTNKLSATWGAVAGASSYEVQVVTPKGQLVSTPSWQNVGTVTATSLTGLPLQNATKYLFAVRAIGPNGPSVDAVSPGVTVYFPDGGTDGGQEGGSDASVDGAVDAAVDSAVDSPLVMDGSLDASLGGSPGGGGCGCYSAGSSSAERWLYAWGPLVPIALVLRRRRSARRAAAS